MLSYYPIIRIMLGDSITKTIHCSSHRSSALGYKRIVAARWRPMVLDPSDWREPPRP